MKKKFGIFDIIIVLLLICAMFFAYKIVLGDKIVDKEREQVTFTVEVKCAEEDLVLAMKQGDIVYNSINDIMLGKVVNVETKDATEITTNSNKGVFKVDNYENQKHVYLTIHGYADSVNDKHIILAEKELKVGTDISVESAKYVSSGYIVEIDRLEDK